MKTADSVESLMRSEECKREENTTKKEDTLVLRRSISEDLSPFPSNDTANTSPKARKNKSIKSRLSFRLRSFRDRRLLPRKTQSSDALQQNSQNQSADDLATESSLHTDLGSGEVVKKKRKLAKKFLLGGIKWPKSKTVDENLMTIATQTSTEVRDHTAEEVAGTEPDQTVESSEKSNLAEPKQKLLITISGRKTEYKSPSSPKAAYGDTGEGILRLNITCSEKNTPPTERAPACPYQEPPSNLAYTVASTDHSQPEFPAQRRGAVRKSSRSPRLERQASREEFLEDDKLHFLRRDLSQERGSRFPRPANHAPLKAPTIDERLSRVLDYVNETFPQNNLNALNAAENEVPINTPEQTKTNVSDTPPLRDIQKDKNSSIFHSVNSNDSDESPLSDAGRKRIKYVGQPTLYTDEEKEILEGKRAAFRNLAGISEYSFESDLPSETQVPTFSDLVVNPEEAQIMTSGGEKREHLYKILVIGELGTGKTSFIKRYVHQFFSANYRATIGVDFALKVLHWDQNTIVRLQLWDIAGQERFGNMTRVYYKEAVGAFIVFDVTRSGTFDAVNKWKEDLDSKVQLPGGGPIPCILLANKCDQDKQGIVTNPEKMDEYVKENGFSGWFETSAKENINIEEAARALVSQILLNDKLITAADILDNDKFALGSSSGQQVTSTVKKNCAC